jgi:hypothetical protein
MFPLVKDVIGSGYITQNAGTPITFLMPARPGLKAWVESLIYKSGTTAHVLYLMRALGKAAATAAVAASATSITIAGQPSATRNLASGDYVVIRQTDGSDFLTTVSGAPTVNGDGTVTITLAAGLSVGCANKATLWMMGVTTDAIHLNFPTTASQSNTFNDTVNGAAGIGGATEIGDPLLFYSANGTAPGYLNQLSGVYLKTGAGA